MTDAATPVELHSAGRDGRLRLLMYASCGNICGSARRWSAARQPPGRRSARWWGLDHDEYGIEHLVLDGRAGALRRCNNVYIYPEGEPDPDCEPVVADLPVHPDVPPGPGSIVDGPTSRAHVAALFDILVGRLAATADHRPRHTRDLGVVFTPFAPWWDALDLT
jgi:hypothetical protein